MAKSRSWPREGPVTFVATKVTKKAFSRKASLPHKAFTPQSSQNHGLLNLTATSFAQRPCFGKVC
ncbi:hypothetical protein [Mucilaginibacter aquaedulcis]|uniref:hypothetical protein n=1 Tax=Mucilaginibacter aquaedulcis TaxID=1187081 RepID=UPI0025B34A44|nr:hypothetical protein [Mucilaginibacter aquaedulcis]MDN3547159.1 hypothetical protein [Mucilaginibacter aquaedulcis]